MRIDFRQLSTFLQICLGRRCWGTRNLAEQVIFRAKAHFLFDWSEENLLGLLIGHQLVSQVASRLLPGAMITEDCFS